MGEAYVFAYDPGQVTGYSARRRDDDTKTLQARSVKSLGNLVRADAARTLVPRALVSAAALPAGS